MPWVRICQLVKGALGRKVLSLKTAPGREHQHVQGVSMCASGERIIEGLLARSWDARAELKLAADELAVVETMLEYSVDSVGVLQMTGDDKKLIICSDCGKVHPTRATVKSRPGGLVCVSDCGLLTGGRRKRPAEGSEPPPPSKKPTQLAVSDEEQPPPPLTTYKQPSTAAEVHPSGEPQSAAMPPPAPQSASRNEPPALLVQCVSTEPSVAVPPSPLLSISDEAKDALFAKYGSIGPVASQSFASLDLPPIDDANAGQFQPPRLDVHRSAAARGPGSEPALWFKQVPPCPPSAHAAVHRLLTSLIFAVSLTDDGTRVGRGRGHLQGCRSRLSQAPLPEQCAYSAARAHADCAGHRSTRHPAADPAAITSAGRRHARRSSRHYTVGTSAPRCGAARCSSPSRTAARGAARCSSPSRTAARACRTAVIGRSPAGTAIAAPDASVCAIDTAAAGSVASSSTHYRRTLCGSASACDVAACSVATAVRGAAGAARSTANVPAGSSARDAGCGYRAGAAAAASGAGAAATASAPRSAAGGGSAHAAACCSSHRAGAIGVSQPLLTRATRTSRQERPPSCRQADDAHH